MASSSLFYTWHLLCCLEFLPWGKGMVKFFSSFCDRSSHSSHFLSQRTMLMIMLLFSVFLSLLVKSSKSRRDFSGSFAISILECERKRRLEK